MAVDTAGRTVLFAAITVVIALLGLLLLGLSFMQGVALGAATAVLATMFAALTVIPALIGGSGNFIDGVLHEYDERGGFRFWGTKRRFSHPRRATGARRRAASASASAPRAPAGSAGRTPSSAVRGSPLPSRWRCSSPWPCRRSTCAWAPATPASIRPARRRARPTT